MKFSAIFDLTIDLYDSKGNSLINNNIEFKISRDNQIIDLRAINLDKIDRFLANPDAGSAGRLVTDPEADKNRSGGVAQCILNTTTRAEIDRLVKSAVLQAVSAWGALGPARLSEAKPYSTENMSRRAKNMREVQDATRLQETSAQLDQIVNQRFGQKGGPRGAGRSAPSR